MSVASFLICLFCMITCGKSIPPSQCFEPFNFDDCGRRPLHVLYYYKPGSRCEVAIWRGCPTRNMFKDEYECINTCIYRERAKAEDYHNFGMEDDYQMPLDYGEGNDTMEQTEGTTVEGETGTGPDGEGATESGGSDKEAGEGDGAEGDGGETGAAEGADGEAADTAKEGDGEDAPAEDAPAEDAPAEDAPAEEAPAEEAAEA